MTRPNQSPIVLCGDTIKFRLLAERSASKTPVHVDWLRFTVSRRNLAAPSVDVLFPSVNGDAVVWERLQELSRHIAAVPNCDTDLYAQAAELAADVAVKLGDGYAVNGEIRKGHDFYKHRLSIERNGVEVGWCGFGASSDSPRQAAQARTLHVNLYGAACTFAEHGWRERLADLIDANGGDITRCDLALDFFDGFDGGMQRVKAEWAEGLMDHRGNRPKHNMIGPWGDDNGRGRSFYFGSKEAGKQTNVYEKGDQLYGADRGSNWLRVELRWGNKLRVLSTDMLRRPADFFACASDWHAAMLDEAGAEAPVAESVQCKSRAASENVMAECYRVAAHVFRNAGPCVAALIRFAPQANLNELADIQQLPARLKRFAPGEIARAFSQVFTVPTAGGFGPALISPQ